MPIREPVLVNGYYYHVYNRGVEKRPIFLDKRDYNRFIEVINFYRFNSTAISFSRYKSLPLSTQKIYYEKIFSNEKKKNVDVLCFELMPNHFHFLLQQKADSGISKFIMNISDSYTKFFNTKNKRVGSLFQGQFKAKLIETDEQLFHVSRYIHLNPYSSALVKNFEELEKYPWSSLPEYIAGANGFCDKTLILDSFKGKDKYKEFVFNQAQYQKKLEDIKHLIIE